MQEMVVNSHTFIYISPCCTIFFDQIKSKNYLNQYIRTYTCLNNNPGHGRKIPISGSSNKYTLDEQCRLDFGKDYGLCQNVSNDVFATKLSDAVYFVYLK